MITLPSFVPVPRKAPRVDFSKSSSQAGLQAVIFRYQSVIKKH